MPETIISKRCSRCKEIKPVSEFARHKGNTANDCLAYSCKVCVKAYNKIYRQTEAGKEVRRRGAIKYRKTEGCKEAQRRGKRKYRQTEYGKEQICKYKQTEAYIESMRRAQRKYCISQKGRNALKARRVRYRKICPEKAKARTAVGNAVARGKLWSAKECECVYCGEQARNWHHWAGYEPEHWFDIIPLCQKCDSFAHGNIVP